jgi:hypothetical protein
MFEVRAGRPAVPHRDRSGQALVEFALLVPILLVLVMGIIEFGAAFSTTIAVNRASQNAGHAGAIAGRLLGSDCLVLGEVEKSVSPPAEKARVLDVRIQRTALAGNLVYAQTTWTRTGSTACELSDGTSVVVPYTRTESGYPENQRCDILRGCPTMTPARSTVDNIGVAVRYRHRWLTPLGSLLPFIGGVDDSAATWTFEQRNIFRMEPNQ